MATKPTMESLLSKGYSISVYLLSSATLTHGEADPEKKMAEKARNRTRGDAFPRYSMSDCNHFASSCNDAAKRFMRRVWDTCILCRFDPRYVDGEVLMLRKAEECVRVFFVEAGSYSRKPQTTRRTLFPSIGVIITELQMPISVAEDQFCQVSLRTWMERSSFFVSLSTNCKRKMRRGLLTYVSIGTD